jgi:RimJ/RimL family protein N-acetyltransferase
METNNKLFESERLYVRHYTIDDFEDFFHLNGDEEVMRYIRQVKSREENYEFLKEIIARYETESFNHRLALLEKHTNTFVGSFAFIPLENTPYTQVGYSFLKEYWGKGYATEITKAGLEYVFNVLCLAEVKAVARIENIASQKVLLKNGFVFQYEMEEKGERLYVYGKGRPL